MLRKLRSDISQHRNACVYYADMKGGEYDFGVEVSTYDAIKAISQETRFTARIPLTNIHTRQEAFDWLCEHALETATKRKDIKVIVAVDECQKVSTKYRNAEGLELLQENGHLGVDLIFTTHRPSDVHGSLRAACDTVIVFQTHHTADIKVFQEHIDVPDNAFKALKQDEYLEWNVQKGYRIVTKKEGEVWEAGNWITAFGPAST